MFLVPVYVYVYVYVSTKCFRLLPLYQANAQNSSQRVWKQSSGVLLQQSDLVSFYHLILRVLGGHVDIVWGAE